MHSMWREKAYVCVFLVDPQVNIYADTNVLRPVGNPPLAGDQVRLNLIYLFNQNKYIRLENIMDILWQQLICKD